MDRVMVFNRLDAYVCDLDPDQLYDLRSVEEINGEHALTITTRQDLAKTSRIVLKDGMGYWHEYVVTGIVDTHETDQGVVTEYYCVWSIQYDLSGTFVNNQYGCGIVPGHASEPHPVQDGLAIALSSTTRWQIGTTDVTSEAAASFYRRSGWEALQTVIEKWGGELQATIDVGPDGVVGRYVDLLEHVGANTATRRFDYGHDVASIKRTVSEEVWPCRIIPLGASQETDEGGYTRRPTIESVNDDVMWLEDGDVAPYVCVPDGNGGWEYPTVVVENDTYEDPADLKEWALANITNYTRPRVTYEASVVQLARAGMNPHGVALGDAVVVVDREFRSDGLRITARVTKQECNLLDPTDTVLTIGNTTDKLSGQFSELSKQVSEVATQVANESSFRLSAAYVARLLERINDEANATGGFTYITEGQGIRTYDVAVTDPLVGAEASAVVEVKGGTVRIANTKTAQGQWEWKTIFTSGYVNAEVIRAIGALAGSHVEVTPTGVYLYSSSGVKMLVLPTGLEVDNEAGTAIFKVDTSGGEPRTRAKELHTWDTTASVTMTAYTARDSEAADGDTTVTVTVNGTEYTLDATYASVTITPGASVAVNLTQAGVPYVRDLMVELDDDGNVIATYPSTLSVEYTLATTVRAKLSFTGNQVVDGVSKAIVAENTVWSSENLTDVFLAARNAETGAEIMLGVGAGGHNRGVYDRTEKKWLILRNADGKTIISGPNFSVDAVGKVASSYEVSVKGTGSTSGGRKVVALRSNTYGNRGIYDVTSNKWIVLKSGSNDKLTYFGLYSSLEVTSHNIVNDVSVAAGDQQVSTASISKSGWYPIGIVGWSANTRYVVVTRCRIDSSSSGSGTIGYAVYNNGSTTRSITATAYVLWARGD